MVQKRGTEEAADKFGKLVSKLRQGGHFSIKFPDIKKLVEIKCKTVMSPFRFFANTESCFYLASLDHDN